MAPYLDDMTSSEAATRLLPAAGPAAGGDELDDLFDYDAGLDDAFRDITPPRATAPKETSNSKGRDILGLDEQVEVAKKIRAPKPKLDENRLLSSAGIPKLRKRAKDFKLKGKGHEYSDAARMLQLYQLWLDDLFPKAKFLDALAMVEKEGHKRRLQSERMGWINEGKPKDTILEEDIFGLPIDPVRDGREDAAPKKLAPIFENGFAERLKTPEVDDPMDDATPLVARTMPVPAASVPSTSLFGPAKATAEDEPEDDLDALLAEANMEGSGSTGTTSEVTVAREPDFDDEMEAMQGMDEPW